jgi:predicted MFS family arabinose efflux permease
MPSDSPGGMDIDLFRDWTGPRLATRLAFGVAGFGVACWAPPVPFAKQRLQVDDGTLGLLLPSLGIGSVIAMLRTGPLCARLGCRPVIVGGGFGMVLLLPALVLASTPLTLALALLAFGAALGSLDVAMNVHAVEVERAAGPPLMSGFHALFSVGGFAGSALMTFLLSLQMSALAATLVCASLMAVAMALAAPRLLHTARAPDSARLALPRGPVLLLAALAAVMFLVEGALLDWSALLLTDTGLASAARAGIGYVVFSVAMTCGRFAGDAVTARLGDAATVFWSGLLGVGAANVVPVLFRGAGTQRDMPAALAVSAITTVGYAGYLLGPAAVGFVASQAGLPAAFWALAALLCAVPLCARALVRHGGD